MWVLIRLSKVHFLGELGACRYTPSFMKRYFFCGVVKNNTCKPNPTLDKVIFSIKNIDVFYLSTENIHCGYSLELQCNSNEYLQCIYVYFQGKSEESLSGYLILT